MLVSSDKFAKISISEFIHVKHALGVFSEFKTKWKITKIDVH